MAGCEFAVLVAKKGCLGGQYGWAGIKRKLLVYGNGKFLRTAKKGLCRRKALGLCKRVVFEGNSQGFLKIKNFLVCKSRGLSSAVRKISTKENVFV